MNVFKNLSLFKIKFSTNHKDRVSRKNRRNQTDSKHIVKGKLSWTEWFRQKEITEC